MILVTGGSGFIGSHLIEQLCAREEGVRCLLRRKNHRGLPPQVVEAALARGPMPRPVQPLAVCFSYPRCICSFLVKVGGLQSGKVHPAPPANARYAGRR